MTDRQQLVSLEEAAARAGVALNTLRAMVANPDSGITRYKFGRVVRVDPAEVLEAAKRAGQGR